MANKYSKRRTKQNAQGNETEQASFALTVEVRITITGNLFFFFFFSTYISLSETSLCYVFSFSSTPQQKPERQCNVEVISSSAWQGFRRKVCLLVPFMWPRGSVRLQGLVILCVGLLGLERVINVFVPIYSRNIGETRLSDCLKNSVKVCINLIHTGLIYTW